MVPARILAIIFYAGVVWTCLAAGGKFRTMSKVNWEWPKYYTSLRVILPPKAHRHHQNGIPIQPLSTGTGVVRYYDKRSHSTLEPSEHLYDTLSAVCASVSLGRHHPISTTALMRADFLNSPQNQACFCTTRPTQVDLGSLRYPRYLTSVECSAGPCSLPGHNCEGRSIKIWVLKQREEGDIEDRHAPLPPRSLRESYIFEGRVITVACGCSA